MVWRFIVRAFAALLSASAWRHWFFAGLVCGAIHSAWADAANVSYQFYFDSDSLASQGCSAPIRDQGASSSRPGFEYRLELSTDQQGHAKPARWSVCNGATFVDVDQRLPIQVLAGAVLATPKGWEDVVNVGIPWALMGDADSVRVVVTTTADALESTSASPSPNEGVVLQRPQGAGSTQPPDAQVRGVPGLSLTAQSILLVGLSCVTVYAWRRRSVGASTCLALGLLLANTPWPSEAWAGEHTQGLEKVGIDAAGDAPAGTPDLLSLHAMTQGDILHLSLHSTGNNHPPTSQPVPAVQQLVAGQTSLLRLTAQDLDGDPLHWVWLDTPPAGVSLKPSIHPSGATEVVVQARFEHAGLYSGQLQVLDPAGALSQLSLQWQVEPAPLDSDAGFCKVLGGGGLTTDGVDRKGIRYATVTDYPSLRQALDRLEPYVYVPSGVTIEIPNKKYAVVIHSGQTLFGDRGQDAQLGGLLRVAYDGEAAHQWAVFSLDSGARVSGLRIEGPFQGAKTANNTIGLQLAANSEGIEVDNSELYGWPWAAVSVKTSRQARIRHNYIHHNIKSGLGYGVVVQNGKTSADIACNVFYFNRHAIAGSGQAGESYEAHHNLIRPGGGRDAYHQVDMHAYPKTTQAGSFLSIHDNWFDYGQYGTMSRVVIGVRGIPTDGPPQIYGNFFNQPYRVSSTQDSISLTLNSSPSQAELLRDNTFKVAFKVQQEAGKCVLSWLGQRQAMSCPGAGLGP